MIFKGFSTDVLEEMRRWNLSSATMRAFRLSLMPLVDNGLGGGYAQRRRLVVRGRFADPEIAGNRFYLQVRVDGDDNDLWAYYVHASLYDDEDRLVWLAEAPKPTSLDVQVIRP